MLSRGWLSTATAWGLDAAVSLKLTVSIILNTVPETGVVARIVTGPHDANRQDPHLPMRYDTGRTNSVIRLRISQPRTTSLPSPVGPRARRPSPMMDLYRKERVLHPARYLDAFFHWRWPSVFTDVIVRSHAGDREPWPDPLNLMLLTGLPAAG